MRRLTLWALACITLGAATTVVTIVVLAALPPGQPSKDITCSRFAQSVITGTTVVLVASVAETPAYRGFFFRAPSGNIQGYAPDDWDPPIESFVPPDLVASANAFWHTASPLVRSARVVELHGWPCLAAYSVSDVSYTVITTTTGWPVHPWSHERPFSTRPFAAVIPLQPIWGGLAINTALFGGAYALVLPSSLWLAGAARRRRRAARSLCTSCGYDLKGAPSGACPECGKAALPVQTQEPPCVA
jgi:hypothetical protein